MVEDSLSKVKSYLESYGLTKKEVDIYLELNKVGPVSALQLSSRTGYPRTQVYRYLDNLSNSNLISSERLSYGTIYSTMPLSNLEAELEMRIEQAQDIKKQLPLLESIIKDLVGSKSSRETTIKHYYGLAGIKQANWNTTKARSELRVFEQKHINQHLNDDLFVRRLRERMIDKGIMTYDLTNNNELVINEVHPINLNLSKSRYISPNVLEISFELYIYDSTVTLLDYTDNKMMAVEINNLSLAKMMTQIFGTLWKLGKPPKIIT